MRAHGTFRYKFENLFLIVDFSINFRFLEIGKVSFSIESGVSTNLALIIKFKCKYW